MTDCHGLNYRLYMKPARPCENTMACYLSQRNCFVTKAKPESERLACLYDITIKTLSIRGTGTLIREK